MESLLNTLQVSSRSTPAILAAGGIHLRRSSRFSSPSVSSRPAESQSLFSSSIAVQICLGRARSRICWCSITSMAEGDGGAEDSSDLSELNDVADFDALASSDGCISICGFGSLLSEKSARSTFPELRNFRVARLRGFRRVFAHTAPVFFERGIANAETGEISSLSVEPREGEILVVTIFEIKKSEIPSFIEREHEFRFLAVFPEKMDGSPFDRPAVLCARYSDDEYFRIRCKGSREMYHERYGRYDIQQIWRDDILPCRVYLRHCVLAAKNLGEEAYENFLDHTFIGDRRRSIREYLASAGRGIMEEEPPQSLKIRYGG